MHDHLASLTVENKKHNDKLQDLLSQFQSLLSDYSSLKSDYEEVKEGRRSTNGRLVVRYELLGT